VLQPRLLCALVIVPVLYACGADHHGTAALTWDPVTQNTDGTPMTRLAGYKVYYGRAPWALTHVAVVRDPHVTSYTVRELAPGRWFFAVAAYSRDGTESGGSKVKSKVIQ
jgi:hypothetical protein